MSLLLVACALLSQAAPPPGWYLAGSQPADYDCGTDSNNTYQGQPSAFLKSKEDANAQGFGTLMQDFSASRYLGKRIRLSANLKSENLQHWGALWMRVDDANHQVNGHASTVAFDNMKTGPKDRSIKGTTPWQNYSIVLDVPQEATGIFIGFMLNGPGSLWANGIKFEIVGLDVPVTGQSLDRPSQDGPSNLSFDK